MSYIKYAVVTKINYSIDKKEVLKHIKNDFNMQMYTKKDNSYLLKKELLNKYIKDLRSEFLKLTNNYGDSLNNCEAYCIEEDINKVINSEIVLISNNEKYYFKDYKDYVFDTDIVKKRINKYTVKLYLIPIFWDIYQIKTENFYYIEEILNNLTKKVLSNPLKKACIFTVI